KAVEKEKQAALKAEKEKAAKEKAEKEKAERLKAAKEKAERELVARERAEKDAAERAERERAAEAMKAEKAAKQAAAAALSKTPASASPAASGPIEQAPILARMPKKNKPTTKPIRIPREDHTPDAASTLPSAATSDAPQLPETRAPDASPSNSRAHSVDRSPPVEPVSIKDMLQELHVQFPWLGLSKHSMFDPQKINPASKVPLEYGPLVHALSALSVGGGSFANNMPSTSIDNAVSSFQQLLETLTQTISDLLRLLPRTTWDDSSSFDGVLRDMLKGDDFLDDSGDD
ncbi:hypothetical protein BC628DRAFT_1294594, partial [Trametes gibbosa]